MKWISTKDRLPEHGQEILLVSYEEDYQCPDDAPHLFIDEDGNPDHYPEKIGVYDGFFHDYSDIFDEEGKFSFVWVDEFGLEKVQIGIDMIEESGQPCHITHWMPLPEPPSRDEIERVAKQ